MGGKEYAKGAVLSLCVFIENNYGKLTGHLTVSTRPYNEI